MLYSGTKYILIGMVIKIQICLYMNITKMEMVNGQQPIGINNVSSMPSMGLQGTKQTLTPEDRLQLASKQHYTQVQQINCPYLLQQHKSKLKVKTKQYIPDLGQVQKVWQG